MKKLISLCLAFVVLLSGCIQKCAKNATEACRFVCKDYCKDAGYSYRGSQYTITENIKEAMDCKCTCDMGYADRTYTLGTVWARC